jgi:succinoglycan biosynthesis transport protein ExoP
MAIEKLIPRTRQGCTPKATILRPQPYFVEHESGPRSSPDEPAIVEYWRILVRRRKTVFVSIAVALLVATVTSMLMKNRYSVESRISVGRENPDMLHLKDNGFPSLDVSEYNMELDAQVQILTSDTLILENLLQLRGPSGSASNFDLTVAQPAVISREEQKLIGQYGDQLVVSRIPHTPLISIKFSDQDSQFAADFVNGLVHVYIEQNFKTKYESARQVSGWLSSQLEDLRVRTAVSQSKMAAFQKETGILGTDDKQNIITQKLDDLNRELTSAQADRIQKEALYQATASGNLELLPGVGENSIIKRLKEQQAEVSNNYAQATADMGAAHPKVLELKSQLKQIDEMLESEFKKIEERNHNAYLVASRREAMLRSALDSQKEAANKLNEKAVEYERLKHEVQSNQQLYDSLSERLKESGISAGLRSGNVRVVDYAHRPLAPSVPNIPLNVAAGLFLGCIGGATLAFILERVDNRMLTALQIEDVSALPLLGVIPEIPAGETSIVAAKSIFGAKAKTPDITISANQEFRAELLESYRALSMSLFQTFQGFQQVILITSALPSEGKTTTCINCATVLAQQGDRVLLVDADLRASRVKAYVGICASAGLTTMLTNGPPTADGQAIVQHASVPNLFILPAGPVQKDPWSLLASAQMKQKISEWRQSYSRIIIDTPPVLAYSDALALASIADSVVLVVSAGKTPRPAFLRARNLLRGVNAEVSGIVANGVDFKSSQYGAYGYYDYAKRRGN